ncbi:hypothetical protein C1T28_03210 [Bacillus subtilis]|nr:hypothetical protein C1T25_10800 [Bacillus cereus]POO76199.1 hypothetical protein C1T28_03210 [Bacillus subtilis]
MFDNSRGIFYVYTIYVPFNYPSLLQKNVLFKCLNKKSALLLLQVRFYVLLVYAADSLTILSISK